MEENNIKNIEGRRNKVITQAYELSNSHPTQTSPRHLISLHCPTIVYGLQLPRGVPSIFDENGSVVSSYLRGVLIATCIECDVIHSDGASERLILYE